MSHFIIFFKTWLLRTRPSFSSLRALIARAQCKCSPTSPDELRCHIFRHGRFKTGTQQMDPHTPKTECDRLSAEGLIYGCGKPFKVTYDSGGVPHAVASEYI